MVREAPAKRPRMPSLKKMEGEQVELLLRDDCWHRLHRK